MTLSVQRLSDLEEIRDLAVRYCQGLDREDRDLLRSAFWPDATDDHGWLFEGNAWEFIDAVLPRRERVRPTQHCVMNHRVSFDADGSTATGEAYCVAFQFRHALQGEAARIVVGRYLDKYERREGEWRIGHRRFVLEGVFNGAPTLRENS